MDYKKIEELKARLKILLQKEALKRGEFVLSSGKKSNYYLDGRIITLTPEGAFLTAGIILEMVKGAEIDAVGGPALGADPITGAVACLGYQQEAKFSTFIVRKAVKGHGMQKQIEGPELKKGARVVVVDDVATSGKALLEAKEALDKAGIIIDRAIVIVDRNEGAKENLAQAGIKLEAIFNITEFGV